MKILDVRAVIVDGGWRNWVFVMVETDEGLTGFGECTLEGRELAVVGAIEDFKRHLVGEPAENIRSLCRRLSHHGYWETGPVISSGIGGIEMALWDLKGKSMGLPLNALLGGAVRQQVPVYSNAWYFGASSPEDFADCAKRTVALGYRGLKFDPFETADFSIGERELGLALERVQAVRDAVGGGVSLMVEGHGRFGAESALRVASRLQRLDVRFFEEPTPPGDYQAIARVCRASAVPIAAGERAYGLRECQSLIEAGISVLQPDVIHLGGISKMVAAAELCEATSVSFAPHNASGPVATAATLHMAAIAPTLLMQEMFAPLDTEWKDRVAVPAAVVTDGYVSPLPGPGIGIALDAAEIGLHPYVVRDLDLFRGSSILGRPVREQEDGSARR